MNTLIHSVNRLKMLLLVAATCLLTGSATQAQTSITNYTFAASNGSFTALSGATIPSLSGGNRDDGWINSISIGFDFWYMGTRYTTASVSTNGWMAIGSTLSGSASSNNLSSGGTRPMVAPLWDDLNLNAGTMSYLTSGSAPNRVFTFEWLNAKWNFNASAAVISFQVKLYETTGQIEFVYKQEATAVNLGSASIGIAATSGGAGNFLSLDSTTTNATASSTTETTSLSTKPANGQVFSFTPNAPTAMTDFQITFINQTSMTLGWTDNSLNEQGFIIYRSLDGGSTFTYLTQVAANTVSYNATGLTAGSLYHFRIYAVAEGALSSFEEVNDYTLSPNTKTANFGSYEWNNASAWTPSGVPVATDSVVIPVGSTITVSNYNSSAQSLNIYGTLTYNGGSTARTMNIYKAILVQTGGVFNTGSGSATKALNIGGNNANTYGPGNLQVDGTFDMDNGSNQQVSVTFFGNNDATVTGSGATCDFYSIVCNKGTSITRVMDIQRVITIGAPSATANRMTTTAGTLKISSASNLTPWYGTATPVGANGRLILNHASCNVSVVNPGTAASDGDVTINGYLQVDAGTFSYGSGKNRMVVNKRLIINGGTTTIYGRLSFSNTANTYYTQTAGSLIMDPQAANQLATGVDVMAFDNLTTVDASGGSITIIDPNFNSGANDYELYVEGTTQPKDFDGVTFSFGNGVSSSSGSATSGGFQINIPTTVTIDSMVINNPAGTDRSTKLTGTSVAVNKMNIVAGTLNMNGKLLTANTSFKSTGVINATTAGSHITINGTASQTIGGTIVSSQIDKITCGNTAGVTITPSVAILSAVTLNAGTLASSGTLTLGAGGATSFTYTRGDGSIGGSSATNYGTGTLNFAYVGTSSQTTGSELPATVATGTLTINNASGVILNASLSIQNAVFTAGKLTTTAAKLLTITGTTAGAVTKTTGYVSGPLKRTFPNNAASATYLFPVGKSLDNSFDMTNVTTSGSGTGTITVEVFDSNAGGTAGTGLTALHTNHFWYATQALGSVTITTCNMRMTDTGLVSSKAIGRSNTVAGAYASIGGGVSGNTITSSTNMNFGYFCLGDKGTLAGGTYTVGTAMTYSTLTAVAAELNGKTLLGDVIFELTSAYGGTGETFPMQFFQFDTSGGAWTATIRVAAGAGTRTVSGNPGATVSLINLSGVDRLIIDGREGGTGSTIALNIRNTRTTGTRGPAIQFQNDATNDTVRYVNLESQSTSATSGVVNFSTSTGTTGNDNNSVEYCNIHEYTTTLPLVGVYAAGTAGLENDNNSIRYNNIYNCTNQGVSLTTTGMGNNWNVSGNSFYHSYASVPALAHTSIKIVNGYGHTVSGNYIGGAAANCGGSAWENSGAVTVEGISLQCATTSASNVNNNTISNIYMSNSGTVNFDGIKVNGGLTNIGTSGGNTIGHASTANSIRFNGTSGSFNGIRVINATASNNVENNIVANITTVSVAGSYTFSGVYSQGANIRKNRIYAMGSDNVSISPSVFGIQNRNQLGTAFEYSNNMISLDGGSATEPTIYGYFENATGSGASSFYYNTINVYGSATTVVGTSCFYRTSGYNHYVKNNIFSNNRVSGGLGHHVAIANAYGTPATGWVGSDYNALYATTASDATLWNTTYGTLASLQGSSSDDAHSVSYMPTFISNTDLHLDTAYNCMLNGHGTVIGGLTTDFDGTTRSGSTPDIGFDELPYMPKGSWFGYSSSAWNSTGNWCDVTVPTSTYDVEIDPTAYNQPIVTTGTPQCRNLQVNSGATLTLNGANLRASGTISSAGTITTNGNKLIANGTSAQNIGPMTLGNFEVDNTSNVTMVGAMTVNGTLTLVNGKVNVDTHNLTIGSSGSISGADASKYIVTNNNPTVGGYLIQNVDNASTPVFFPVGTSTYNPARITNSGASSGNFRVRAFNSVLANGTAGGNISSIANCVNRTWLVENVAAGTYNVDLRLQWNLADENASFDRGNCGVGHYTAGAWDRQTDWGAASPGTVANSYYYSRSGLSSFSPFGVGDRNTPLPVKMLYFNANGNNNDVQLTWATASEQNNDRFEIERSLDSKVWNTVGEVMGNGNSNRVINYSFTDANAANLAPAMYYRLRQVDFNGKAEYSNIAIVNFGKPASVKVNYVTPNPFRENMVIGLNLTQDQEVTVKVIDLSGRELVSRTIHMSKDDNNVTLNDLSHLATGMYTVQVSTQAETVVTRIMKTE